MQRAKVEKSGNDGSGEKVANTQKATQPGTMEWVAGGVSAAITLAIIGFLLFQAFTTSEAVPRLEATVDRILALDDTFHVELRVVNRGNATAAGVLVQGRLTSGSEVVEEKEVTFDYVPAHSEVFGALFFDNDPGSYQLHLDPHGYREP